ncbi:MAG: dephospho-CoA kinase [Ruminobacter sp.]|nr:dephospho-CoA kinase [Ruminobacter sp.]
MSKWVLGLTGGIGTGKTTASNTFKSLGCKIVDADIIARELVAPKSFALGKIIEYFGENARNDDGSLNRKYLRSRVFLNSDDKKFLDNLLHPLITNKIKEEIIETSDAPYIVLVAPLLFENKLENLADYILCMDIDNETQISRIIERDKCSLEIAQSIVNSQLGREIKIKRSNEVIKSNFKTPELLEDFIKTRHQEYLKISKQKA